MHILKANRCPDKLRATQGNSLHKSRKQCLTHDVGSGACNCVCTPASKQALPLAGVYHGAESVAADTCLYVENFAYRVATSSHLNAMTKAQVTLGFDYYLGREGNTTAEELAAEVGHLP